jgi:hypothetical protein
MKNKHTEKEIRKSIPFTIPPKKFKYLGINLTKEMIYLYNENYNSLKKVIKEYNKGCNDIPYSWISRIDTVRIVHYGK